MDVNSSSARDYQSKGLENFRSFSLNTEVNSKKVRDDSIDASRTSSVRGRIALISGCPFRHGYSDSGHTEPPCCPLEPFLDFACVFRTYPEWKKKADQQSELSGSRYEPICVLPGCHVQPRYCDFGHIEGSWCHQAPLFDFACVF